MRNVEARNVMRAGNHLIVISAPPLRTKSCCTVRAERRSEERRRSNVHFIPASSAAVPHQHATGEFTPAVATYPLLFDPLGTEACYKPYSFSFILFFIIARFLFFYSGE
ncbi:hypothetical protein R1flu_028984 [Riccia fluitans]|uniref:Uncharacterized protein n=1 Tax=Riccia fluitans TaxID=41844 RepID=A0ABD1XR50_9MARC